MCVCVCVFAPSSADSTQHGPNKTQHADQNGSDYKKIISLNIKMKTSKSQKPPRDSTGERSTETNRQNIDQRIGQLNTGPKAGSTA